MCNCLPCTERPFIEAAPTWDEPRLRAFFERVTTDPAVIARFPAIARLPLTLQLNTERGTKWCGQYDAATHSIELAVHFNGLNPYVLLHEIGHACVPLKRHLEKAARRATWRALGTWRAPDAREGLSMSGHDGPWREAFLWLAPRFLGPKVGDKLARAFTQLEQDS